MRDEGGDYGLRAFGMLENDLTAANRVVSDCPKQGLAWTDSLTYFSRELCAHSIVAREWNSSQTFKH